jgi:hypothetical protein
VTDDIFQLIGEVRIVADFEALDAVWLEPMLLPDETYAGLRNTDCAGHTAS